MRKAINKFGNIEIEDNLLKYRIAYTEVGTDDPSVIEKGLKRKLQVLENSELYLLPFDIQLLNRYFVLFYEMKHYKSYDYLRTFTFEKKLQFFLSLIRLAKAEEKGVRILWDRNNFVVDPQEESIKAILFETDELKIYEYHDPFDSVVELITMSLTTLNRITGLPRRVDFIDPSDHIIQFVEQIFKITNLDDLYMFIEAQLIDVTHQEEHLDEMKKENKWTSFFSNLKIKQPKQRKLREVRDPGKKRYNKNDKIIIVVSVVALACLMLYFFSPSPTPPTDPAKKKEAVTTVAQAPHEINEKVNKNEMTLLIAAYRYALNSEYDKAYSALKSIKHINKSDEPLIISTYFHMSRLNELLDENPQMASDVITFLGSQNHLDDLPGIRKKMKTTNPYVEFEVGYLTQDYKTVLKYKNQVKINGRKEEQIVDAYIGLNQFEKAREFANSVGNPDLLEKVDSADPSNSLSP